MESTIETIQNPDGNIQRFQIVAGFAWKDIKLAHAPFSGAYVGQLAQLYRVAIIPKAPEECGHLVFFHVPEGMDTSAMPATIGGVTYYDPNANLAAWIESGDPESLRFLSQLEKRGYVDTADGKGGGVRPMPVSGRFGFVSDLKGHQLACNAHFFLMDTYDAQSPYDLFGTPYGMTVEGGRMVLPPLHHRPALAVDKDGVHIIHPELKDVAMVIDGVTYRHGVNCTFYERPDTEQTPAAKGTALMVADGRVVASKQGGRVRVPMGGFVIQVPGHVSLMNPAVSCRTKNSYQFALQVGPAMMVEGNMAGGFDGCPFCHYGKMSPFPPTVYPLSWETGRAGRMVLGNDQAGNPVLVWAEAAGALGYEKGKESCGCSLSEMASFCQKLGLVNAINLDGGGSSQICYQGSRLLHLKDRTAENKEAERPVPGILTIG